MKTRFTKNILSIITIVCLLLNSKTSFAQWVQPLGTNGFDGRLTVTSSVRHLPENVTVIMPYKKPANKELELNEKILNVWISFCRIVVEHAISGVERMRCVLDQIRLRTTDILDKVMLIACGLHNIRVKSRI